MTIFCATSDFHGYLPEIPPCDVLLIAGDIVPVNNHKLPFQRDWIKDTFEQWLQKTKQESGASEIILCWGNHDHIGEEMPSIKYSMSCTVLTDELHEFEVNGESWKIWGSPWTKRFFDWSFNMDPEPLAELHSSIPPCDIVVTHGPPYGFGDLARRIKQGFVGALPDVDYEHTGSPALTDWIVANDPKLVVFGHIHGGFGTRTLGDTIIANVSYVSEGYRPTNPPQVFELTKI